MKLVGLTGGFASGKSTVRQMFRLYGADVLDADAIYHDLIAPKVGGPRPLPRESSLAREIDARFPGVLGVDGVIDRSALGRRVFDDAEERKALERIAHPRVAQEVARRVEALEAQGSPVVIYDVPLLFEAHLEMTLQGIIVVWVPRQVQLQRLVQRDGITAEAAVKKLAAQLPLDDKRRRATWVVDNSGPLAETRQQVERLWKQLQRL
jgi:dephospho-CoA kinase